MNQTLRNPIFCSMSSTHHQTLQFHVRRLDDMAGEASFMERKFYSYVNGVARISLLSFVSIVVMISLTLRRPWVNMNDQESHQLLRFHKQPVWTEREEHLPPFCRKLLVHPKPHSPLCERDWNTFLCSNSGGEFKSQAVMFSTGSQDYFLYKNHFQYLRRPGIYVDLKTNHPFKESNTFFFDRCLGWDGLCIESNVLNYEPIYAHRSCQLVPTCISQSENETQNVSTSKLVDHDADNSNPMPNYALKCTTLDKVLERYHGSTIDLLSLSVEGSELNVLKSLSSMNATIKVLHVESQKAYNTAIQETLHLYGYRKLIPGHYGEPNLIHDGTAIFIHASVTFGYPV